MSKLTASAALDPELADAVRAVVREAGQPDELGDLICGGFDQVAQGSGSFDDLDDFTARLLNSLLSAVEVGEVGLVEEGD
ncbi:MAG: hypothetical protein AAF797_08480 [Planctomycetota bacterium]